MNLWQRLRDVESWIEQLRRQNAEQAEELALLKEHFGLFTTYEPAKKKLVSLVPGAPSHQ
jgi:hypothetical protein